METNFTDSLIIVCRVKVQQLNETSFFALAGLVPPRSGPKPFDRRHLRAPHGTHHPTCPGNISSKFFYFCIQSSQIKESANFNLNAFRIDSISHLVFCLL